MFRHPKTIVGWNQYTKLDSMPWHILITQLKPNSITLAGSELVRSWSQAGSKLVANQLACDQLRSSFEPASVIEFGF